MTRKAEEFKIIQGGRSEEEAVRYEGIVKNFKNKFESTLKMRGVFDDFSLIKIIEEVSDGKTTFDGHEKEVFDKIKDLFEIQPPANESVLPTPSDTEMEEAA